MSFKITIVAGARPNFIKIAPIIKSIKAYEECSVDISFRLIHTGQHFDKAMSGDFFEQLDIPDPHLNLLSGGGSQAEQTALIMIGFEKELINNRPDLVLVVGDVTSTMACAITAKKLGINVAHVEAGIRSWDRTMPEEINRLLTDSITDHFFTTSVNANENLINSGIKQETIHFVGNTMIDTLYQNLQRLKQPDIWIKHNLSEKNYFVLTLHRPSNVDDSKCLEKILRTIDPNIEGYPVIFPVHPRTQKILSGIDLQNSKIITTGPFTYLEFIYLVKNSKAVITDSGGITEEATVLNIPCLTLRNSTERPETVTIGSNELVGTDPDNLIPFLKSIIKDEWKESGIPQLWDGHAAERIVRTLANLYITSS